MYLQLHEELRKEEACWKGRKKEKIHKQQEILKGKKKRDEEKTACDISIQPTKKTETGRGKKNSTGEEAIGVTSKARIGKNKIGAESSLTEPFYLLIYDPTTRKFLESLDPSCPPMSHRAAENSLS